MRRSNPAQSRVKIPAASAAPSSRPDRLSTSVNCTIILSCRFKRLLGPRMQRLQSISHSGTAADKAMPNFFIVGAPKCGTTSLHEYLQRHPDVFMPFYKEPHFFGSDLQGSRFRQFRDQPERYLKLFRDARGEKRIGESSPWYLGQPARRRRNLRIRSASKDYHHAAQPGRHDVFHVVTISLQRQRANRNL